MDSGVAWDDDPVVAAWQPLPRLDGAVTADACVIGLGASGLAAVTALVDRGLSVVGLDAGRIAGGAAGRNGGFLLGGAAAGIHDAIDAWGRPAATELYRQTLAELDLLATQLGPDVVRRTGSIRLAGLPGDPVDDAEAADRSAEEADCKRQGKALWAAGITVETYGGPLGRGLLLPDDAAMNPARRALALAQPLRERARLYEQSPAVDARGGRVTTTAGSVSAGVVVVAVDGWLEHVVPALSGRVRTARLQMLATAPVPAGRVPCPVYCRWGYDYAQQDASGRLFVGGGRDLFEADEWLDGPPVQAVPATTGVQDHIERIATRFAGEPVTVTHRWAAAVGYTPDGRPVVAEVEPGLVACGGYNGTGNLVGPIAARAAVELALDGRMPAPYFTAPT